MRHLTRLLRGVWGVAVPALVLAPQAQPLGAQGRAPGWVGISFEVRSSAEAPGRPATVMITDVLEGSPAAEAGLRPGDVLLAINEVRGPDQLGSVLGRLRIRAGDPVRIHVERDGWQREIHLRAAERPDDVTASRTLTLSFEPDSVVEHMVRAMDSLRDRLARSQGLRVRVSGDAAPEQLRVVASGEDGRARVVQAPFEFFVFHGEAHDSLRREMESLNRTIADLTAREERRVRELRAAPDVDGWTRLVESDEELSELRAARQQAEHRSALLRASMAEAARASAGLTYGPGVAVAPRTAGVVYENEFRPLTPYLLGRNRVAGAEVVDLRPELAQYFGVEGGVLVVDVPNLTPAGIAGLLPGDVVTRLGGEVVRSVEDLRLAVSSAEGNVPVRLIRRGTSIEVLLRR